jgi:hypothetical protein
LFERKRGEFEDGIRAKYIDKEMVIERNLFFRVYFASNGEIPMALQKKLFVKAVDPKKLIEDQARLDRFYFAYLLFLRIANPHSLSRNFRGPTLAKLFFMTERYKPSQKSAFPVVISQCMDNLVSDWDNLIKFSVPHSTHYFRVTTDKITGEKRHVFRTDKWVNSPDFLEDVKGFWATQ